MKTMPWINVPLGQFSEKTMACVAECRQLIRYQPDADWECPYYTSEDQIAFTKQFGDKAAHIGGLTCYACHTKEAHDWMEKGLPIPISVVVKSPTSRVDSPDS